MDENRKKVQLHAKGNVEDAWTPLTVGSCVQLTDYTNNGQSGDITDSATANSINECDTLNSALSKLENSKASKGTTLADYGIENAYTKNEVDTLFGGLYRPAGSIAPSALNSSLLNAEHLGFVYNVTEQFTTDSNFVEYDSVNNIGERIAANTNIVVVDAGEVGNPVYKFDAFSVTISNNAFTGATAVADGEMGLVTKPVSGDEIKFLRGDGAWAAVPTYTHPVTSGNKHIPSGGASGNVLKWSADGTAEWGSPDHQTVNIYAGGASNTDNAATTDGNTYIIIKGASSTTQKIKVVGSDVSVTSDANGVITIDATGKADKQVDATFSSTSLTIKSGYNYTATTALSSLTLTYDSTNKADKSAAQSSSNKLGTGDLETNIIFTVSGSSFELTPPSGTNIVTPEYVDEIPNWENGKKYIVSIYKGVFVFGEISSTWS